MKDLNVVEVRRDSADTSPVFTQQSHRKRWIVILVMGTVVIGTLIWAVWFSSIFAIDQIRVINANERELTEQQLSEVRSQASIRIGEPIALVDADKAAISVATLPWVQSVEIRRGWPNEIVIAVEIRIPAAKVLISEKEFAVDSQGIVYESNETEGLTRIEAEGDALVAAVEVLDSLPENLAARVDSISADSRDNVEITLKSGSTVRWGSSADGDFKAQVLAALLNRKAAVYDVSAPEIPTTTGEKAGVGN